MNIFLPNVHTYWMMRVGSHLQRSSTADFHLRGMYSKPDDELPVVGPFGMLSIEFESILLSVK